MKQNAKIRRPESLFEHWKSVSKQIRGAKRLLLLLDFDGTLVGFKRRPEDVRLDEPTRSILTRLAHHPRITLGFISGRRRWDLQRRVKVRGAQYWGLHGWEGEEGLRLSHKAIRALAQVRRLLSEAIDGLPRVWLEDKRGSLVLHYRGAPDGAARQACSAALRVALYLGQDLRILPGKKIWEVMPRELEGKGAAVTELFEGRTDGTLAIYAGDDSTDEAAFSALRKGLTIRVGKTARTHARFWLRDPEEVKFFLRQLEELVEGAKDK